MPSIDERVVAMSFENAVFEQRVSVTMATLAKLDTAIKSIGGTTGFDKVEAQANKVTLQAPMSALDKLRTKLGEAGAGAAQGLGSIDREANKVTLEGPSRAVDKLQGKMGQLSAGSTFTDIEKASSRVTLEGLSRALDNVSSKFSVLQGAASVALGNITSQAAMKGAAFAKSFSFGPIQQGLEEYSTNLNSIQTILANTQGQQVSGLDEVNKHLQELNTYSDQTIYNFSQMAQNIGTFTAAGVDLDKATASIKGIANLAALSGSNSQQASTAMYQLSQAIASGKVGLQDWNSVVNAGMGGAVFQKALAHTAEQMHTLGDRVVEVDKATGKLTIGGESFRESMMGGMGKPPPWLTSDVLTQTLQQFTGDLSDAQLAAQGFNDAQIKSIQATAKSAKDAATQVKTLPQVFDVARETIGSGWSATFQTIFGDFGESKKTFTELSTTINGFINTNSAARNKVLADWKALGGRTELIAGIKALFESLLTVIKPIKDAFRDIFPAKTGKDLFEITKAFHAFAQSLAVSPATADKLRRIFSGLFAVLHIGVTVIKEVIGFIGDLFGAAGKGSGGFLSFLASIGDFLVAIDAAVSKGGALKALFSGISAVVKVPLDLIKQLARAVFGIFNGVNASDAQAFTGILDNLKKKLEPLAPVLDAVAWAFRQLGDIFSGFKNFIGPILAEVGGAVQQIVSAVADSIKNANYDDITNVIQTVFIGGLFLAIKKAISGGGSGVNLDFGGGVLTSLSGTFKALTGNLVAMQKNIQAKTLLTIAGAIGVLAASVYVLSTIDPKKLASAMTAVAVGMGELAATMAVMSKAMSGLGIATMPLIAASMVLLAGSVLILSAAMKVFSTMSWEDIGKGLTGVAGSITAVALSTRLIGPQTLVAAAAMIPLAIGINLLAAAMKVFSGMKWEDIAKGLAGVVGAIVGIGLAMQAVPPSILLLAPGLILLGFALTVIAGAVAAFGRMNLETLTKGILAIASALVVIGLAMEGIPPTLALQAAGLVILGIALGAISGVIGVLGSMDIGKLAKGIIAMGAAIVVLGLSLQVMQSSIGGTVALLGAAAALTILAPALVLLGTMKWSTIFKGLAAIALTLGTLAVVGALAAGPLLALGVGLAFLGLGMAAIAGSVYIVAKGLSLLGSEGTKGVAVMVAALTAFVAIFPKIIIDFVKGLVQIIGTIAELAPKVLLAIGLMIDSIIAFIVEAAPKVAVAVGALIQAFLGVLTTNGPSIVAAGLKLLMDLLSGISSNISAITNKAVEIVTKFLSAITNRAGDLAGAGVKLLAAFLNGVSTHLGDLVKMVDKMILSFVNAMASRVVRVTAAGTNLILKFIGAIALLVPTLVAKGAEIVLNFIAGIGSKLGQLIAKGVEVAKRFLAGLAKGLVGLAKAGADAVIDFLNGIADAIRTKGPELRAAGYNVASALIDGIWQGIQELGSKVVDKLKWLVNLLPKAVKKMLGIKSPSTVFAEIGKFTMLGFAKGVDDNHKAVQDSGEKIANILPIAFRRVLGIHSPSEVMRDIGMQVNRGFAQGLRGSADEVKSAFADLNSKLIDQIRDQRQQVSDGQQKIEDLQQQHADKLAEIAKLRSEGKDTTEAVKAAADLEKQLNAESAAMNTNEAVLKRSRAARQELTVGMKAEKQALLSLKTDYDTVTKALETAQQRLDSAIQAREDARKSLTDKFDQTPTVDDASTTKVQDYIKALTQQIAATKSYTDTLARLRAMGLDDTTYQKLLDEGLAGKDFAEQLLKGGQTAVTSVNALDAQLLTAAQTLANNAAKELYDAGVSAAQALVDGLKARQGELEAQMEALAKAMVTAIKRQLKIKSPSRVLLEVGKFAAQGVVDGLRGSSRAVQNAAASIGDDAASAMSDGLSHISDVLSSEIDPDLTITPVLDLTQFQKDAQQLSLADVIPITAAASFGQATSISSAKSAADSALASSVAPEGIGKIEFNQTNTSPESLSEVEIYRQTNNQIAQLKSLVGMP